VGRWSAFWVGGPAFVGRRSSFVGRRSVFGSGAAFQVWFSVAERLFRLEFRRRCFISDWISVAERLFRSDFRRRRSHRAQVFGSGAAYLWSAD
jgi:hypothetical protein